MAAMGTMERLLRLMADKKASDLYLAPFAPATLRINGQSVPINNQALPLDSCPCCWPKFCRPCAYKN